MHSSAGFATTLARSARQLRVSSAGTSDRGRMRGENQDRFAILPEIGLAIVADGMGGAVAGEVAAGMAVEFICEPFAASDVTRSHGAGLPFLVAAIDRANHCIYSVGEQTPAWKGMGTTIACLLTCGDCAVVAHVGDSRVYRLRDRQLTTLTEDHSYYHELVRQGVANPDRPDDYARIRHMLTRALGTSASVEVDARLLDVSPGDQFLLATDGLHGVVSERTLTNILLANPNPDDAVEDLVARANDLGGPDNITAIVVRIG